MILKNLKKISERKESDKMQVLIFTDVSNVIGFGRYAGAYRVATELRIAGYSTQVIEYFSRLSIEDIKKITDKYIDDKTLFVSFSTTLMLKKNEENQERLERSAINKYSGQLPQDDEFVREIFSIFKKKNPKLKIALGGGRTNSTDLHGVDYWFWGMGDASIVALAEHLKHGKPLKVMKGVVGDVISDVDYPVSHIRDKQIQWDENDYIIRNEHLPIEIARGCRFHCSFCANPLHKKKGEYEKEPTVLKQEMVLNYEKFGTTGYMFCDDTFNDSKEKVNKYCSVFQTLPFQLEWTGYARIDTIYGNPEQREQLLDSGLRAVLIGIETLGENSYKGVGKGLHPEQIKETLYYVKEKWKDKVVLTGSFIIGLPGESEDSIWKTVEWLEREDCPLDDVCFNPLNIRVLKDNPFAPLSKIACDPKKYGYEIELNNEQIGASTVGPQWKNQYMNKSRAEFLAREVQKRFMQKSPLADWAVYSRIRNLGYSHNELMQMRRNKGNVMPEINKRSDDLFNQYKRKIIE